MKDLNKEFEQFLKFVKAKAALKMVKVCDLEAHKTGQYDEIDEKVCIRNRERTVEQRLIQIMPELTKQALNYQQCMAECEKNAISYVVANQSCQGVYQKNFTKATQSIIEKLEADQLI